MKRLHKGVQFSRFLGFRFRETARNREKHDSNEERSRATSAECTSRCASRGYHRTLEEYLTASISAGLQLQHLVDVPTPPGSFKRRNDMVLPEGYHFPFFMILSLVKG